jgi:ABC-type multidrug transport system permease subunit
MVISSLIAEFMTRFLAAVSPHSQIAMGLYVCWISCCIDFAGFVVFIKELPVWLSAWLVYLDFMRFFFQGVVLNEFENNDKLQDGKVYIGLLGF